MASDAQTNEEQNPQFAAFPSGPDSTKGLTKRELFAAMAMQGSIAYYGHAGSDHEREHVSELSVKLADALLSALKEVP